MILLANFTSRSLAAGICILWYTFTTCYCQSLNSSISLNATDLDAAVRTLLEVEPSSRTEGKSTRDAISVRNYTLLGCSTPNTGSKAAYLTRFLPPFLDGLQNAIADADMGMYGVYGYNAFFKTLNQDVVEYVFWNIQKGSPLHLKTRRGNRLVTPQIACLGDDEDGEGHVTGIGNLYDYFCTGKHGDFGAAAQFRKSELVVLCPSFFRLTPWPTLSDCPKHVKGGFSPNKTQLIENQFATLIRSLSGLYIPTNRLALWSAASDAAPDSLEAVIAQPENVARASKDSYGYYAACESHHFFLKDPRRPLMLM
ncbi:MAG: hypothetical protein Q9191_000589 [Dirinaria sp. TL-2023a]